MHTYVDVCMYVYVRVCTCIRTHSHLNSYAHSMFTRVAYFVEDHYISFDQTYVGYHRFGICIPTRTCAHSHEDLFRGRNRQRKGKCS